jgi:acyl-CoA dehydrogenase
MNDPDALAILHALLSRRAPRQMPPVEDAGQWAASWRETATQWEIPIDRAMAAGFDADRLAWAFAAGYQAAIQRLLPRLNPDRIHALCITETAGGHPRAIQSRLIPEPGGKDFRLSGEKRFVTVADRADRFLVAASTGMGADGKNRIRLVAIEKNRPGITVSPMPPFAFAPEMVHAIVRFDAVVVPEPMLLPGDGWDGYIKPFRTIEDIHVLGAALTHLLSIGRRFQWPDSVLEDILGHLAWIRTLALAPPDAAHVHLALSAVFQRVTDLADPDAVRWQRVDPLIRDRWRRDRPLLDVAQKAQELRRRAAWSCYPLPNVAVALAKPENA